MKSTILLILSVVALIGCTTDVAPDKDLEVEQESFTPLVLTDDYSLFKTDVAKVYELRPTDSLIFDISEYEFVLPDPAFTFIRSNIDYPKMLGGSWAYMTILYNDSLELRKWNWFKELEEDRVFLMDSVVQILHEKDVDEFIMDFRFYIDNDKGLQKIDKFKVRIVD